MNWTCEHIEERLSEYLDSPEASGLDPAERQGFESHVASCAACAGLVKQVSGMVAHIHELEPLEEPPRLVYAILDRTIGPRSEPKGWRAWLRLLGPVAQPRFAMGVLTVLLTVGVLTPALGIQWRNLNWADLKPANLYHEADRRATLFYARGVKFVNDLRVVYEIQSRLQPAVEREQAPEPQPAPKPEEKKKKESNRAVDFIPIPTTLASAIGLPGRSY